MLGAGARWSPDNITQKFATLDFAPQQQTDSIYSWFVQDQIPLVADHIWLTLGSKFEHNNYTGFELQPNVRLLWTPTAHQSAWVAVTRAVRTPSRLDEDLQLTDYLGTVFIAAYLLASGWEQKLQSGTVARNRSRLPHSDRPQAICGC